MKVAMTVLETFPVKEVVIDVKRKKEKQNKTQNQNKHTHSIRELGFCPVKAIPHRYSRQYMSPLFQEQHHTTELQLRPTLRTTFCQEGPLHVHANHPN